MNQHKKFDTGSDAERDRLAETATAEGHLSSPADGQAPSIDDYERRLQEAEGRALRVHADLENFRRRTRREMDDQLKFATLPLVSDLTDVADNLVRALSAAEAQAGQALVDGVRMVQIQLDQVLEKYGCRRIPTLQLAFDPNVHSALDMQTSDTVPANTIIAETRSGYQLHDRVIRPAQVIVSTGPAN